MQKIEEILLAKNQSDIEKDEYHEIFREAVYFKVHPSRWHHFVTLGWISLRDWMEFCAHDEYWRQFYPHISRG